MVEFAVLNYPQEIDSREEYRNSVYKPEFYARCTASPTISAHAPDGAH